MFDKKLGMLNGQSMEKIDVFILQTRPETIHSNNIF